MERWIESTALKLNLALISEHKQLSLQQCGGGLCSKTIVRLKFTDEEHAFSARIMYSHASLFAPLRYLLPFIFRHNGKAAKTA